MGERGIGAFDRVAKQDDQPCIGQCGGDPARGHGMEHVVGAGLTRDDAPLRYTDRLRHPAGRGPRREVSAIPVQAPAETRVEVVHTLVQDGRQHLWVLAQGFVHRSCAAPLRSGDEERGQHAPSRRSPTDGPTGGAHHLLHVVGYAGPAHELLFSRLDGSSAVARAITGSSQVSTAPTRAPAAAWSSARYRLAISMRYATAVRCAWAAVRPSGASRFAAPPSST